MKNRVEDRIEICLTREGTTFVDSDPGFLILDISSGGCRVQTELESMRIGATVILKLSESEQVAGQVAWKQRDECGVEFYRPLADEIIDKIAVWVG